MPALNEGAVYSPDGSLRFQVFNRGSVWVLTDPQPLPGSLRAITNKFIKLATIFLNLMTAVYDSS